MFQLLRPLFLLLLCCHSAMVFSQQNYITKITVPLVERPSKHQIYVNELLQIALEISEPKFGAFEIVTQRLERVPSRQMLEIEKGKELTLSLSMPLPEWTQKAQRVSFPLMRGLASYRMFFTVSKYTPKINKVGSLDQLRLFTIGQARGWSTSKILQRNKFNVVLAVKYDNLFPMLNADRFQLLMRGIYEIEWELPLYKPSFSELVVAENIAIYTYLPMYFYVTKNQPKVAKRLEYGLKQAFETGVIDEIFNRYFGNLTIQIDNQDRKVFYLKNSNIDDSFFNHDKPYLVEPIIRLENHFKSKNK